MSDKLNNVSYVTLALIGKGGASPHDLVDMLRRGGDLYYAVAPSRLYAEPKRLKELGYVTSVKRPGKTREKTFYTLTRKGSPHSAAGRSSPRQRRGSRTRRSPSFCQATSPVTTLDCSRRCSRFAPSSMPRRRDSPRAAHGSSHSPTGSATSSSCMSSASA